MGFFHTFLSKIQLFLQLFVFDALNLIMNFPISYFFFRNSESCYCQFVVNNYFLTVIALPNRHANEQSFSLGKHVWFSVFSSNLS